MPLCSATVFHRHVSTTKHTIPATPEANQTNVTSDQPSWPQPPNQSCKSHVSQTTSPVALPTIAGTLPDPASSCFPIPSWADYCMHQTRANTSLIVLPGHPSKTSQSSFGTPCYICTANAHEYARTSTHHTSTMTKLLWEPPSPHTSYKHLELQMGSTLEGNRAATQRTLHVVAHCYSAWLHQLRGSQA